MRRTFVRRWGVALLVSALVAPLLQGALSAQGQAPAMSLPRIAEADLRQWLTTLASDRMLGRAAFTEGYGLAAGYVAAELARLGVEPLGADGTYFYPVVRTAYRVRRRSSVTVEANGTTRTFVHGDHVAFPALVGARQRLTFSGVDFVGYGIPQAGVADAALGVTGRLVVLLPGTPAGRDRTGLPRGLMSVNGRTSALIDAGAGAAIGLAAVRTNEIAEVTTVLRVDRPRAPAFTADETFFDYLLAGAPVPFAELRERARRGDPLERFTLSDVRVTIDIDHHYEAVESAYTHNVVGLIRGSDAALRDTYVVFGAHLDHVGAASGNSAPGRTNVPVAQDPIWNGADDNGSGSSALLAVAKALMEGPRPKRSVLVVWHAAEEEGLLGSLAMADDPVVPLDRIQAVFNVDMVGRNYNDDPSHANTLFVVGADRISTDLHNLIVDVNGRASEPLDLDYHYNDPADPESFYTRSDHYSYASRGIPVAFFFTGPHPDYHANTDSADKILFPKLARVAQLVYEAGLEVANREAPLRRDNLGPRSGRGFQGRLPEP